MDSDSDMTAEEVADGIMDRLFGSGWRFDVSVFGWKRDVIAAALTAREEAATRAENEACAKVVMDTLVKSRVPDAMELRHTISAATRSRQTPTGGETKCGPDKETSHD